MSIRYTATMEVIAGVRSGVGNGLVANQLQDVSMRGAARPYVSSAWYTYLKQLFFT